MVTITHMADLHLGHRQYGLKQREDDFASTFRSALTDAVEQHDTDIIIIPGDLFQSRDLRARVLSDVESQLGSLPEDVSVIVSRGNHDENLTPRDVTWLNYLHERGEIVFLKASLGASRPEDVFPKHTPANPGQSAGFVEFSPPGLANPIRLFGLQWRGARTDTALTDVAEGIRAVRETHGTAALTILLAHFGVEDEVPTLGGNVSHADLRGLNDCVDYLALGHIHKGYTANNWIFNPGSPEAHNTREGKDNWPHGYFTVEVTPVSEEPPIPADGELATQLHTDTGETATVTHHETKRRPYYRLSIDVTPYESPPELDTAVESAIQSEQSTLETYCTDPRYTAQGSPRSPIIDLRFTGTLQFARSEFHPAEFARQVETEYNALHVQTNTGIRTTEIQELLSDIDEDTVFTNGTVNTDALEETVFETVTTESQFAEKATSAARVLKTAHEMVQADESPADISTAIQSTRRDEFADMKNTVDPDVDSLPFDPATELEKTTQYTTDNNS